MKSRKPFTSRWAMLCLLLVILTGCTPPAEQGPSDSEVDVETPVAASPEARADATEPDAPDEPSITPSAPSSSREATSGAGGTATSDESAGASTSSPASDVTDVPSEGESPTVTYTHPVLNYAVDFPEAWTLTTSGPQAANVILTSFDPERAPGRGGVPGDQSKIDIIRLDGDEADPISLAERVDELLEGGQGQATVISRSETTLPSGLQAVVVETEGTMAGRTRFLVTRIDGATILMQGYGDLDPFDTVAESLRPAPTP